MHNIHQEASEEDRHLPVTDEQAQGADGEVIRLLPGEAHGKNSWHRKEKNPGRMQGTGVTGCTCSLYTRIAHWSIPSPIPPHHPGVGNRPLGRAPHGLSAGDRRRQGTRAAPVSLEYRDQRGLLWPLQGLEVALRNALHRELSRVFGTSWYDAPAMPLASRAQDLIREAKAAIAHGRKPVIRRVSWRR